MKTVLLAMKPLVSLKFSKDDIVTLLECVNILKAWGDNQLVGVRWQGGIDKWEQILAYHQEDEVRQELLEYTLSRREVEYLYQLSLASSDHKDEWYVHHGEKLMNYFSDLYNMMEAEMPKPVHFGELEHFVSALD